MYQEDMKHNNKKGSNAQVGAPYSIVEDMGKRIRRWGTHVHN
jgi:hypothetical protein